MFSFLIFIKLFFINAHVLNTPTHPSTHNQKASNRPLAPPNQQQHPTTNTLNTHPTSTPPITHFTSQKPLRTAPYQRFTILSVTSRSLSALWLQRPRCLLTSPLTSVSSQALDHQHQRQLQGFRHTPNTLAPTLTDSLTSSLQGVRVLLYLYT